MQVWEYMLEQHRSESAVLVGSSTHNEKIERLWCDVYRCVGVLFADRFCSTKHNRTSNQLFVDRALRQNIIPTPHIPTYAVGNIPIPTSSEAVEVPRSAFLPCDCLLERHDMLHASDEFGYLVYKHVCRIVGSHLHHCNDCS